ncbi:uncharacterized protein [Equus caballus]|uniref:uncharacterized protein isoform X3 n=1 Tax=Equus caballus TaxID=9796 RepID=UPI0038B2DF87
MSTVCVLKVGAFWACSLQKGLQQDRIACLAGQVRLPAPADIFESAERNYWDQRCPDTTASFEAMETWSWQWLSSLRRMPRPLSRRRQLTTKPRFLAVIDTSVWEAKQMRIVKLVAKDMTRSVIQLENTDNRKLVRGSKLYNKTFCVFKNQYLWYLDMASTPDLGERQKALWISHKSHQRGGQHLDGIHTYNTQLFMHNKN